MSPCASFDRYADPLGSLARIGMILVYQLTDAIPSALLPSAAADPAHCVPCPYTSCVSAELS